MPPHLRRGDLLPRIVTPPPGPRSRALAEDLVAHEAPGINTVGAGPEGPVAAPAWSEARGANVLDVDGNRFLDLTAGFGVAAIGHRHPRVVKAVRRQSGRLLHGLGDVHPHPLRAELAARLCRLVPVDEPRVHFGISGAEAVEIALKTALRATGRPGVVAFEPAYHGLTLGALAATSRPAFRHPFAPWLGVPIHRLPFGADPERFGELLERRRDVGAVIFEPVVGREGVLLPPLGWLGEIARLARQHGVLTLADEIFIGFGRTGFWFGVDAEEVRPDLLVCGKALGGGLPIAAVVGRGQLMETWTTAGEALHTATFVAHPVACAAALATLEVLEEDDLPARAARLGPLVGQRLQALVARSEESRDDNDRGGRHPVCEARGRGLLWALELADADTAKSAVSGLLARGVLALSGGPEEKVLQIAPPLTVTRRQLDTALDLVAQTLEEILAGETAGE